ncbi:6-phosphogluconate dehydrogenase, decarboxylating-like [Dermatophagoides farinae]|uniref:6-phosphogluconate dehydrogenase, decarboxylating-like n=1 Tax=Dermatophagoides farinae TaxID=6954 RepID=UPI003F601BD3
MTKSDIGVIGMGVMGSNLALNLVEHGVSTSIYNRSYEKTEATYEKAKNTISNDAMQAFKTLEDFVDSLAFPRKVIIIITSGEATDAMINALIPLLSKGDIILEASNAYYKDTLRRMEVLKAVGIHNLGVGVSGGEEGARNGASIMVGGDAQVYALVEPFLAKAAAESVFGKCVARNPDNPKEFLIDNVLDIAGAKGTGKWTIQESVAYDYPCPTIAAAVYMRNISGWKKLRLECHSKFGFEKYRPDNKLPPTPKEFIKHVEESLYGAVLVAHLEETSIEFSTVLLIELEVAGVELTVPLAEFFESSCIPVEF